MPVATTQADGATMSEVQICCLAGGEVVIEPCGRVSLRSRVGVAHVVVLAGLRPSAGFERAAALPMDAMTPSLWITASRECCHGGTPADQPLTIIALALLLDVGALCSRAAGRSNETSTRRRGVGSPAPKVHGAEAVTADDSAITT